MKYGEVSLSAHKRGDNGKLSPTAFSGAEVKIGLLLAGWNAGPVRAVGVVVSRKPFSSNKIFVKNKNKRQKSYSQREQYTRKLLIENEFGAPAAQRRLAGSRRRSRVLRFRAVNTPTPPGQPVYQEFVVHLSSQVT